MDTCSCYCNEYSLRKQGSNTIRYGFPKKLLVAISILVIITMCLIPTEARTIEHKIRHERRHDTLAHITKEKMRIPDARVPEHKKRPHRKQSMILTQATKDTSGTLRLQKNSRLDAFKNSARKIINKLKNTRRYFNKERSILNETKEYRDGMTSWLPTINFVDIHFHNYKNSRRIRNDATISERKFLYLMPKLYKSLLEFQEIFKLLIKVEVDFSDETFLNYNQTRQELIGNTLHRLYSTIAEIRDNMVAVKMEVPSFNFTRNTDTLQVKVDAPQCLKNDYIAFRAYGNLLNNWYSEFRCPKGKKVISSNSRCANYEAKLIEKKNSRKQKGGKSSIS